MKNIKMVFFDCWIALWNLGSFAIYIIVFLTFIPQSWKRIQKQAKEEKLKYVRFHRCYGVLGECCHPRSLQRLNQSNGLLGLISKSNNQGQTTNLINDDWTEFSQVILLNDNKNQSNIKYNQSSHDNVNRITKMFETNCKNVNIQDPIVNIHSKTCYTEQCCDSFKIKKAIEVQTPFNDNTKDKHSNSNSQTSLQTKFINSEDVVKRRVRSKLITPIPAISEAPAKHSNYLGPVTSIEEILAQRRLSRPLSAYSISDLLEDSLPDEVYIDNFLKNLNLY